jgi:hypothetical protein
MTTAIDQPMTLAPATPATQGDAPAPGPASPADPPSPDPRSLVLSVFPDATASNTRLGGRWTITTPGRDAGPTWHGVLGDGASEGEAWEDAAEAVEQARAWGWGGQRRARGKGGRGVGGPGVGQGRAGG